MTRKQVEDAIKTILGEDYIRPTIQKPRLVEKSSLLWINNPDGSSLSYSAVDIFNEASKAGLQAGRDHTPTPMLVAEHVNMFDDKSPIAKAWSVSDGVCGHAWIKVKAVDRGRWFINELKRVGLASGDVNDFSEEFEFRKSSYHGGFLYWVHNHGQSYERKRMHAKAFADVLNKYGIKADASSRLD